MFRSSAFIGKAIQIVQSTSFSVKSTTSSTYQATNLSGTITLSSVNSKVLIFVSATMQSVSVNASAAIATLKRGATDLDFSGGNGFMQYNGNTSTSYSASASFMYVDSPASTSSLTYQCFVKSTDNATTVTFGTNNGCQTMILVEIASS